MLRSTQRRYENYLTEEVKEAVFKLLILATILAIALNSFSQCTTGCTSTVSTNTNLTVNSGTVVCLTYSGNYTHTITLNGGTLCISPATHITTGTISNTGAATINNYGSMACALSNFNSGYVLNNYGTFSGSLGQGGGTITNYSGGTFSPSSFTINSGSLTNNSGGSISFTYALTIPGGYTLTSAGTSSFTSITINGSGIVSLTGTQTIIGNVSNSGTFTLSGPSTIGGNFSQNGGATTNLSGGITISGSAGNNGTINLSGNLSVGGSYSDNSGASVNEQQSGCSTFTIGGTNSGGNGTFNGGGYGFVVSPAPSNLASLSNGASGPITVPTQQPTTFSASITAFVANVSFNAPSSLISGYIVLRHIGSSATTDNPVSFSTYSTGSTIGGSVVVAMVGGGSTGTKAFTDTLPAVNCGQNVYYRIFSYNGSNACHNFDLSSPLTGTVALSAPVTTVNSPTICGGATATLTATGSGTYHWNTGATTASISAVSAGTYSVTVTAINGCTASASGTLTVHTSPTLTVASNTPVCVGSAINLSSTASGSSPFTYSWSGPTAFTASTSSASVANANTVNGGTYNLTVTDANSCTATATTAVTVNANCVDSTTVGVNGGASSDAPCTQILRFDHYNDAVASSAGGQNHTWILKNGNILTMTITRLSTAGGFTAVTAPTWSGAAFGQSGYTGLTGKTVLYTNSGGYAKLIFSNIQMHDSLGRSIANYTLIGIDGESTDNAERDTLTSNGTTWFDYDTITPPSVGSVPSETGIGTSTLVWTGTGPANARARLVSTNNPTNFTFSTVAGGLQGYAMGVSNPIQAPNTLSICSGNAFNATPTNLPAGTTYTWTAPVISPAGSITGATAQLTGLATVGQTLINTTSSAATATYSVLPSNNCSGLGYTVTVTVNPNPKVAISPLSATCSGTPLTITASPSPAGTYTYHWSGPNAFSNSAASYTNSSATAADSGNYTVTVTDQNACSVSATALLPVVTCVDVIGSIFDNGPGNGISISTATSLASGISLYALVSDSTGHVVSSSPIASNGSFTLANIPPHSHGYTLVVNTSSAAVGSVSPGYAWPPRWSGTLGQYGTNNMAGTGVDTNHSELLPIAVGSPNVTNVQLGYDLLPNTTPRTYTITHPAYNTIKVLTSASGLGTLAGTDAEDGNLGTGNKFLITAISGLQGNQLFYDANGDGVLQSSEQLTNGSLIANYSPARLYLKFIGLGASSASFQYAAVDAAGKADPTPATYLVSWMVALPVKLLFFTADQGKGKTALLQWATATETNNQYFEVQRSADAATWNAIGQVPGAINSVEELNYNLTDNSPLPGVNYYRLKQVDVDGNVSYSDIAELNFTQDNGEDAAASLTLYPNPVVPNSSLYMVLNGKDEIRHFLIATSLGQPLMSEDVSATPNYMISALKLHPGDYVVTVLTTGNKQLSAHLAVR